MPHPIGAGQNKVKLESMIILNFLKSIIDFFSLYDNKLKQKNASHLPNITLVIVITSAITCYL